MSRGLQEQLHRENPEENDDDHLVGNRFSSMTPQSAIASASALPSPNPLSGAPVLHEPMYMSFPAYFVFCSMCLSMPLESLGCPSCYMARMRAELHIQIGRGLLLGNRSTIGGLMKMNIRARIIRPFDHPLHDSRAPLKSRLSMRMPMIRTKVNMNSM